MGLGGYTSAILADRIGLTPWIGMLIGALVAALMGFMIGIVTLRLRAFSPPAWPGSSGWR